jgi:hypothetical protein
MAVLMEVEVEASTDQYDQLDDVLDVRGNPPKGFIAHSCEDIGGGSIRIRDLWESAEDFGDFAENRLGPAIAQVIGDDAPQVQPNFTELHRAYGS